MKNAALLMLLGSLPLCAQGCGRAKDPVVTHHSFARPDEVVVEHLDLDLVVDFDARRIRGRASLFIRNRTRAGRLFLDTRDLRVARVTLGDEETPASFSLGAPVEYLGAPLSVDITPETQRVDIEYETSPGASALGWLEPGLTAGGVYPFLYTQGQAINNRSWIPCQDTPAVRVTYRAKITVPPGMTAVMSARNPTARVADGVYTFDMPQPIPPYLIALAVGDIDYRPIGDRCGVYAEPGMVDRAAWEFAETAQMIAKVEELYGAYRWERFDVLVLPSSFPYGGMENPRLTFVTPVLVAGDRSLVSTIAHELAHSWSGNLVTNASWNDFWLNEGVTTYIERRIIEALYGTDAMEMEALLGLSELEAELADLEPDHPDTRLRVELDDRDPESGLTWVPYDKGYLFLRMFEEAVGRERWDEFLGHYFEHFAFRTITSEEFVSLLRRDLISDNAELEKRLRIDEWIYGTGIPDNRPRIVSAAADSVAAAVTAWTNGTRAVDLQTAGWSTQQWKQFIRTLPSPVGPGKLAELEGAFGFTSRSNAEILQVWFVKAIENGYEPAYPAIEHYLTTIGRIWLISSVYRALAETPEGLERAKAIYSRAKTGYHPLTVVAIDRILAPDDEAGTH
jgi:aminopeptidase N